MCSFVAHSFCASLPLVVKVIRHKHTLNLTYSFPATQSSRVVCKLCVDTVNTNYAIYYCSSCDFVAHLGCAISKEDRDETFLQNFEDKEFGESSKTILEYEDIGTKETIGSPTFIVKMIKVRVDGIEIATEIKHLSHEHDLELVDKHGINEKCDGCVRSIFPPFYTCAQCRFFLHKSCVELPTKIRHPLHEHPLMLLPRSPEIHKTFRCDTCHRRCNGFIYQCGKCDFHLDVQCSLIPYMFKHDCHEHQLRPSVVNSHKASINTEVFSLCKALKKVNKNIGEGTWFKESDKLVLGLKQNQELQDRRVADHQSALEGLNSKMDLLLEAMNGGKND
ncbi:hypothetical protein F2P56_034395 [Juglans regia]|uniref:DC1 domain-containing protein n=1 Tax=Juglans regia TaxID=51240 RepID=A0A833SPB1_JUGRE|nr:hypothetical protein F2P56_034395 [Juglans regia]